MANPRITDDELMLDVQAYYDHAGDKTEAARARGIPRQTFNDRLGKATSRLGIKIGKVADGTIGMTEHEERKLPKKGSVARYLITSAQNNTHVHPGINNLLAYRDWLDSYKDDTCELIVGTFSYQKAAYGIKSVKRGTYDPHATDGEWYAPELEQFIVDHSVLLAPGLVWCGEQNILPTNKHPLREFDDYNGRASNIIPHAKIELASVASMAEEATKFNYSTGTITQRNYIQKKSGIIAERAHNYGALIVEVNSDGSWFVRQIYLGDNDDIMELGPKGVPGVYIQMGIVNVQPVIDGIVWGDMHAAEMDVWVKELCWGPSGMLNQTKATWQVLHDVFSMRNRSPHELKDPRRTYEKWVNEEESVEDEVIVTAEAILYAERKNVDTLIVHSNHDRHLDRWLAEADPHKDPVNKKYYHWLWFNQCDQIDAHNTEFNLMEFALREQADFKNVEFLASEKSHVVGKEFSGGIELSLHGDRGPNGSAGSTAALRKLGRAVIKGHDHKATISGNVKSVGACAEYFPYTRGPHSRSVTHAAIYQNGTSSLVTMWQGEFRA